MINKKLLQTELRLQNDLIELKRNRITTKLFITKLSDIIKDVEKHCFYFNFLITNSNNDFFQVLIT